MAVADGCGCNLEMPAITPVWGKIAKRADPFGRGMCLVEFLDRRMMKLPLAEAVNGTGCGWIG